MKRMYKIIALFAFCCFCGSQLWAQGVGYNPINNSFLNVATSAAISGSNTATYDFYFDFYKAGVTDAGGQGAGVVAVAKLRTQSINRDGTFSNATVVYQTINATYVGDSGNNDRYKAVLPTGLPNGRYSWECEVTHGGTTYYSWSYGTNTGNSLQYFTVGSAGIFRSMLITDFGSGNVYRDLLKFQPGNTDLPALLSGPNSGGFCSSSVFKIGGEVNTYKNNWFGSSNVTANRMYYRLTAISASGSAPACLNVPGVWNNFTMPFRDDCPYSGGSTPTYINTFAGLGGSCQIDDANKVDQRWDRRGSGNAMVDVLPAAAAACTVNSTTGAITYRLEIYTETDITVTGTNYIMRNPLAANTYYTTTFTVNGLETTSVNGFPASTNGGCFFSPLPIQLTTFAAKADHHDILLNWKTATERNSHLFAIERSADANHWHEIGAVAAKGYSDNSEAYSFVDANPYASINYYRLRKIDRDGQFQYSAVASAIVQKAHSLHLYPNPVTAQLTVELGIAEKGTQEATFGIYNIQGVLARQWAQTLEVGNNRVNKDLSDLAAGIYILRITDAQGSPLQESRFVKK